MDIRKLELKFGGKYKDIDSWLMKKLPEIPVIECKRRKETLPTHVRHCIHHSEHGEYTKKELQTSINALKKLDIYSNNNIAFDSIVLDVQLPDINGVKLGRMIKEKYPQTNIVFISGYTNNYEEHEIANLI